MNHSIFMSQNDRRVSLDTYVNFDINALPLRIASDINNKPRLSPHLFFYTKHCLKPPLFNTLPFRVSVHKIVVGFNCQIPIV